MLSWPVVSNENLFHQPSLTPPISCQGSFKADITVEGVEGAGGKIPYGGEILKGGLEKEAKRSEDSFSLASIACQDSEGDKFVMIFAAPLC